jgi:two-component system OmpR family sensor kinase
VIGAWRRLGLRGRLALSFAAIVIAAFAVVFVVVRIQMSHETAVIHREEAGEAREPGGTGGEHDRAGTASPIADAQDDVEKTFLLAGAATLVAAILAGSLLAARTAAPLRRYAATAAAVDAGDLTPRLDAGPGDAAELRVLADSFNGMLDRLDEAFARQRRFVSDASHELRSPLTAIRGQIEVLGREESPSAADIRRVEATTLAEMRRVERLVEDLLALARLDEGAAPALREVEVEALLRELAAADPAGATEVGELAAGTVPADPDLIAQVVRNLLANAHRHAGPEGRVVLSAQAVRGSLLVAVDDDGPGIAPAERERVFDRFHRSDEARDRGSGGSGLGLAIARAIVERHGGVIRVEDSPLGGARVRFSLPGFAPNIRDLSPSA